MASEQQVWLCLNVNDDSALVVETLLEPDDYDIPFLTAWAYRLRDDSWVFVGRRVFETRGQLEEYKQICSRFFGKVEVIQ